MTREQLILAPAIGLRNLYSKMIKDKFPTSKWEPPIPNSIEELESLYKDRMMWREEKLDYIRPIKNMNHQLLYQDCMEGDCDDLATWVGYMLKRMHIKKVYRVNIAGHKHVICVYELLKSYFYISNNQFNKTAYNSIDDAVIGWCIKSGKPYTKWYYVERL
jgi:hypothetical protein